MMFQFPHQNVRAGDQIAIRCRDGKILSSRYDVSMPLSECQSWRQNANTLSRITIDS